MLSESTIRVSHAVFANFANTLKVELWQIDDDIAYVLDNGDDDILLLELVCRRNVVYKRWTEAERIAGEFSQL